MPRHPGRLQLVGEKLELLHRQAVFGVGSPGPHLGYAVRSQEAPRTSSSISCHLAMADAELVRHLLALVRLLHGQLQHLQQVRLGDRL